MIKFDDSYVIDVFASVCKQGCMQGRQAARAAGAQVLKIISWFVVGMFAAVVKIICGKILCGENNLCNYNLFVRTIL